MDKFTVINFHPKHVEIMELREIDKPYLLGISDAYNRLEIMQKQSLPAFTFILDGRIIFCAGVTQPWGGVLEGWMIPSVYVKNVPLSFCRTLKRYIEQLAKTFNCHRFQTTSLNDAFHERWMEFLGFQKEGTMRQYTHEKQDYCIYSRLF